MALFVIHLNRSSFCLRLHYIVPKTSHIQALSQGAHSPGFSLKSCQITVATMPFHNPSQDFKRKPFLENAYCYPTNPKILPLAMAPQNFAILLHRWGTKSGIMVMSET